MRRWLGACISIISLIGTVGCDQSVIVVPQKPGEVIEKPQPFHSDTFVQGVPNGNLNLVISFDNTPEASDTYDFIMSLVDQIGLQLMAKNWNNLRVRLIIEPSTNSGSVLPSQSFIAIDSQSYSVTRSCHLFEVTGLGSFSCQGVEEPLKTLFGSVTPNRKISFTEPDRAHFGWERVAGDRLFGSYRGHSLYLYLLKGAFSENETAKYARRFADVPRSEQSLVYFAGPTYKASPAACAASGARLTKNDVLAGAGLFSVSESSIYNYCAFPGNEINIIVRRTIEVAEGLSKRYILSRVPDLSRAFIQVKVGDRYLSPSDFYFDSFMNEVILYPSAGLINGSIFVVEYFAK